MKDNFFLLAVGSALLIVSRQHKVQAYDDLVSSILLAQLVASKKVEKNPGQGWYDAYVSVLDDFWLRSSRARRVVQVNAGITQTPLQWLASLEAVVKLEKGQMFAEALAHAAGVTRTEPAMAVMHKHMEEPSETEPPLTPRLLKDVHMLVILAPTPTTFDSVYLEFKTNQETSFTPWARFQTEEVQGPVCIRTAQASLSETLYQPVRDAIAAKVRDKVNGNVVQLDTEIDPASTAALG
ncbi:hypothetical protein [Pseudomonas sp. 91RF]|uniref:hypothetical protein n=1 Tax=Pseudomonas sp. 91RF TaxID=2292261 RepID=UPI0011C45212|nr:hypothetical protein [Pseudomonas sp. 91RF]